MFQPRSENSQVLEWQRSGNSRKLLQAFAHLVCRFSHHGGVLSVAIVVRPQQNPHLHSIHICS
jgi:hypothetical protein